MTDQDVLRRLNANRPACLHALNASVEEMNREDNSAVMSFTIPLDFCHSGNVVQGGFAKNKLDQHNNNREV